MKSFDQKKKELTKLKEKLAKSKLTIFTSFSRAGEKGLSVKSMQALKKNLRAVESEYAVEKKTLLDKALKEKQKNVDIFSYDGSLGVVFGYGEVSTAVKSVYEFSRKNPALKLFSAIFGDTIMDNKTLVEFAKLPTKDVMIGRFLGLLKYPLSSLANILGEVAKTKLI